MQQDEATIECDVLVVGGGPAGSTAAALLQRAGRRVLILEKGRHPRFHIGESLLPANLPIFEELGVLDKVRALGVLKLGADFPDGEAHRTFYFRRALGGTPPHAFQVKREEFDRMLFEHAREMGADAREGVDVERVDVDGIGGVVAHANNAQGRPLTVRARYLVDASGRDTLLASQWKLKRRNAKHQSAAIFAHFRGVEFRAGEDAGNISIYRFEHGWCWFIPLREGVMSVGCVCAPEHLKRRRGERETFLAATLDAIPLAGQRMRGAVRVSDVCVTGNYSYAATRMAGPGWVLVGDAYAFVDPIFSSGVYLAMHSAQRAAALIDDALATPAREAALQAAFAKRIRRGIDVFSWFIYRFNSPAMKALFGHPRNVLRVEDGVISMLAGDVFDSRPVRRRLRLFKFIYALTAAAHARHRLAELIARRRQTRAEFGGGDVPVDPA